VAGQTAAGGLGIVKVLLLMAPFAFVAPGCSPAYGGPGLSYAQLGPRIVSGLDVLGLGANITYGVGDRFGSLSDPLIVVPVTGVMTALAILLCIKRTRKVWRRLAGLAIVLSVLSLGALFLSFNLLPGGGSTNGQQNQLLLGGWGMFGADAATIIVLVLELLLDTAEHKSARLSQG
jgi:hypothetical protein